MKIRRHLDGKIYAVHQKGTNADQDYLITHPNIRGQIWIRNECATEVPDDTEVDVP